MRIAQIVSSVENSSAGTSYVVPRLCRALAEIGQDVDLLSLGGSDSAQRKIYRDLRFQWRFEGVPLARKLGFSNSMRDHLRREAYSIYHAHGLWMMPNVYPAAIARSRKRPFLLSPHGMLGEAALEFSHSAKRLFWLLAQGRAARLVDCFHATSAQEYEAIRAFGLGQPVALIPNGIDLPDIEPGHETNDPDSYVLSLGRIHPKKGLDRLIGAWAQIEPEFPGWRLKIVGPDEGGYAAKLSAQAQALGLGKVEILPPSFGEEKHALMRDAELFVLPTLNENFAMTVPESLSLGTPVISTKGAPWEGLVDHRCGWWIDHGEDILAATIREALCLSRSERAAMGMRGRDWVSGSFDWDEIARKKAAVYAWLSLQGDRPEWVVVD
jgi:glycosyltransferase involved in cell wall biosynthesis